MNLLVLNRHIHISLLLLFLNFYRFLSHTKQSFEKRDIIFRHINVLIRIDTTRGQVRDPLNRLIEGRDPVLRNRIAGERCTGSAEPDLVLL